MTQKTKGTVLVTGGSGFLGGYTAAALHDAGYSVRVFDATETKCPVNVESMIHGDITDQDAVIKAAEGCDYIYHLAGIADIEEARGRPVDTARVNVLGTLNALEAARINKVKRFIFASTVYVYSDRGSFYRVSKQACENYIETYEDVHDVPYTILRYGSLYGRRAGPTNGIHRLIKTALETGEIVYNGDENAMREYIHIADAAKLSVEVLDEKYKNRHMMLTGNERMRVTDIMRMIAEMLPNKPELKIGEKTLAGHYVMTPYSYSPKLGQKLVSNDHIELGQGLLDCIAEMSELHQQEQEAKAG